MITPCSVCNAQPLCQLAKPSVVAFDPPPGTKGSGVNNVLQVVFSVELKWCPHIRTPSVDFWCDGSQTANLGTSYIHIVAGSLRVDISDTIKGLMRAEDRKCGLTIPSDVLCDSLTSAPFAGVSKGTYFFTLTDVAAPAVIGYNPNDGATEVDPNSVVEFTFSEQIVLGPSTLFVTLTTLNTENSGDGSSEVDSKVYELGIPHVSLKDSTTIMFDIKGKTSPGWLYSISLPRGAVVDLSGNKFQGLGGGQYTFRVQSKAYGPKTDASSSGTTTFIVVLVASLVCGGFCIGLLIWRFQNACYIHPRDYKRRDRKVGDTVPKPKQVQPVRNVKVEPATTPTSRDPIDGIHSSGFYGMPGQNSPSENEPADQPKATESMSYARAGSFFAKPERIYPDQKPSQSQSDAPAYEGTHRKSSRSRSAPPGPGHEGPPPSSQPSQPFEKRSKREPPPRPEPSASKAPPKAEKTATPTCPVVESSCPEAKAVEKKMRDMMNEPVAVRKKLLKDLMLEHHPDKNDGSESSKETFQFINAARGWFLHDA